MSLDFDKICNTVPGLLSPIPWKSVNLQIRHSCITGLPLLFKTKIQGQFKVFANILPRIQGFCTFFKVLNNNHNFFLSWQTFTKIYFHVYTKQDEFHTVIDRDRHSSTHIYIPIPTVLGLVLTHTQSLPFF